LSPTRPGPELSVIVPTLNEAGNIALLYEALKKALEGIDWEMIIVDDDSRDGTVTISRALAARDRRVRCLRRLNRRGLSGAVVEGILSSSAFAVAVIDADLQHDERLLPHMLRELKNGADLVVGSRHAAGGQVSGGFSWFRERASDAATWAAKQLTPVAVSDPMSGFFAVRRTAAEEVAPRLSNQGFKILLDLILSSRTMRFVELGYTFRPRRHGASKLDSQVIWDFAGLLVAKATGDRISIRFLAFCLVGLSGLAVHLAALNALLNAFNLPFEAAQAVAAGIAMVWNFAANNVFTYRDRRLVGLNWLWGLLSFCAVCSIGAVANVGVASWLHGNQSDWWVAGAAGALMGAVFNFAVTSTVTWRRA
jgi:dolichol-phosphate mannosyltransferase